MRKMNKSKQVLAYIAKNPKAKPKEVAEACGVKLHTVYNITYTARKSASNAVATLPMVRTHPVTGKLLMQGGADIVTKHHTDMVNSPPHYKTGGIETIDFIEAKKLDYNLGNAVKYITRADHKGDKHEDLCKARWYLNRAIASVSNNT